MLIKKMSKFDRLTILKNNYEREWNRVRHAYMDIILKPDRLDVWYVRVRDIKGEHGEFEGGEYIVELTASDDPIAKPPLFKFLTPNGLYQPGSDAVCISIGRFHGEKFSPAQGGMGGFCAQMVDILVSWRDMSSGASFLHNEYYSYEVQRDAELRKRKDRIICMDISNYAKKSKEYNRTHYPQLIEMFDNKPFNVIYSVLSSSNIQPEVLKTSIMNSFTRIN
jgi:ubiquitin-protein ligase